MLSFLAHEASCLHASSFTPPGFNQTDPVPLEAVGNRSSKSPPTNVVPLLCHSQTPVDSLKSTDEYSYQSSIDAQHAFIMKLQELVDQLKQEKVGCTSSAIFHHYY
ncbi:unnamed protein product [Protopolystoma xenopodis]|uniref:Uncharacterized protein n=1 Tax=Protopolystoma xenopodis TaxID=117903 RepID=A0A3S5A9D5_9PLAT|nr:unnamed protein product [Protopolystoma xenopodis]